LIGCDLPDWLWVVPLLLLPLTPWLNGTAVVDDEPLRWPESAGFTRPRRGIERGLVIAAALCLLMGGLRLASVPQAGCWETADLTAWNLPNEAAFDRNAPSITVIGYVSNFPTVEEERQEVVVTVGRLRQGNAWHEVQGQARLLTRSSPRYLYGQPVEVSGRLVTPPDFANFSYREVLARRGFTATFMMLRW
jgi:competence protein ComEC